jgi:hypothetical protein
MRTKEFEVPVEIIAEFADAIAEHDLDNEILGSTEEGEIIVEISYEPKQRHSILVLTELIEDYQNEQEEG